MPGKNCKRLGKRFMNSTSSKKRFLKHESKSGGKSKTENDSLPIAECKDDIVEKLKTLETMIILGETGCGKTTQIPKYILEHGINGNNLVVVTQPRRIAAVSIAHRVSKELAQECGETVGYKIRFENVTGPRTKLIYATDGTLMREAINDELLLKYSVVILDEAHERTVTTDILFGIVQTAQETRKSKNLHPLKVIIMSALLDADQFHSYFKNAPVCIVEGRGHKVDVCFTKEKTDDYYFNCLVMVLQIHQEASPRDAILVFLTGQEEIEKMAKEITEIAKSPECKGPKVRVHTLYAAIDTNRQLDILNSVPDDTRKIIVSTNIAETSLTIPGVKFVIDSGKVKVKSFNPVTGVDILKVEWISQEQAVQRAGRAGREFDGVCHRMYSVKQFEDMKKSAIPEIHRCNLSAVSLTLLAMNKNPRTFNFINKPEEIAIKESLVELHNLGAIPETISLILTDFGRKMSLLPLDPKYSKILLKAEEFRCVEEILSIIAMLSSDNIFVPYSSLNSEDQDVKLKFHSNMGDHLTFLNVFRRFNSAKPKQEWCRDNLINFRAMDFAKHIKVQLRSMCSMFNIHVSSCGQDYEKVRKCLVTGLFKNIAILQPDKTYSTVISKQRALIHPSSVLHKSLPLCVLFTELIKSSELYMKTVTVIDPDWLSQLVPNYSHMKTSYLFPHLKDL